MQIFIGNNTFDQKPVVWKMPVNSHWCVIGATGVGKTFRLRRLLQQFQKHPLRIHLFDCHGDLATDQGSTSSVTFSEGSPYGINPLAINPDPDFGGVRRRTNSFLSMVNRYTSRLGVKQEAVLRNLLVDLYAANKFYLDRPDSWGAIGKKTPAIGDLLRFSHAKLKTFYMGDANKATSHLETLCRKLASLDKKVASPDEEMLVEKLRQDCKEKYAAFIDNLKTGREVDDLIKYDSKDVLRSVYNRVNNLNSLGIFRDREAPFHPMAPIWRYDIRSLTAEEQGFLVEVNLERIFAEARQNGIVSEINTLIVLDEAQKYLSEEPDHIVNVMIRESRKFGIGMIFASQDLQSFPDIVVTSCATKLILGVDELHHDYLTRKLGIEAKKLRFIRPRQTGLIQIKRENALTSNKYVEVQFN
ncbi:MAG: DUF87 domain-containing protein [Thermodesulfovibrionales bacterium]|jgi:hypothetical protein